MQNLDQSYGYGHGEQDTVGQHGERFHHETAHPEMPHAMNFRLMLSNHGNPAKAKQ